ncbi:hypothetical protein EVA_01651 [gut metagenome]|uniref:Uncharacterized protein n=1 Tax=gut metagenome TaxID=749906 RepID=J9GPQ9_9ZZZZ
MNKGCYVNACLMAGLTGKNRLKAADECVRTLIFYVRTQGALSLAVRLFSLKA